jgi:hypothetical protein
VYTAKLIFSFFTIIRVQNGKKTAEKKSRPSFIEHFEEFKVDLKKSFLW